MNSIDTSFFVGKYQFKIFKKNLWLKIFYHFIDDGKNLFTREEAFNCNSDVKYSILSELNSSFQIRGKYEFLLEYNELGVYNRWRQTHLPNEVYESGEPYNEGFEEIHSGAKASTWGGLSLSNNSCTIMNGTPSLVDDWCFSVGQARSECGYSKIPVNRGDVVTSYLWLWIRVPKSSLSSCKAKLRSGVSPNIFFVALLLS